MKPDLHRQIEQLKKGTLSAAEFLRDLQQQLFCFDTRIKLDFQRQFRRGLPEVIYGREKSVAQLAAIVHKFSERGESILITKVEREKFRALSRRFPKLRFHHPAGIVTFDEEPHIRFRGKILVVSAGAADECIAEEAYVSARYLGNAVDREYDMGVACLARVLGAAERFQDYAVIIAVAGMEGALPSVVAGLTATPVIAVPTSVGYGANLQGVTALLAMLNSCSGGVSVVNIDNGFGAAYQASLINQKIGIASIQSKQNTLFGRPGKK